MTINFATVNMILKSMLVSSFALMSVVCFNVYSLTLGNMKVNSSLSQPLNADIEIFNADDVSREEILVNLASRHDFDIAQIKKYHFLSDIQFDIKENKNNRKIISIYSTNIMQQPSFSILLELHWPKGRVVKEYTVLLNPIYTKKIIPHTADSKSTTKMYKNNNKPNSINGKSYRVRQGDTLWSIANKLNSKYNMMSNQEIMDAIFKLNQDAFYDGDRAHIITGSELLLPATILNKNNIAPKNIVTQKKPVIKQTNNKNSTENTIDTSNVKAPEEHNIDSLKNQIEELQNKLKSFQTNSTEKISLADNNAELPEEKPLESKSTEKKTVDVKKGTNNVLIKEPVYGKYIPDMGFPLNKIFNIYTLIGILLIIGIIFWVIHRRVKHKHDLEHGTHDDHEKTQDNVADAIDTDTSSEDEKNIKNPMKKAEGLIERQQHSKAVLVLNQALSIDPNDQEIMLKLLELYCNIGDTSNAVKMLARCYKLEDSAFREKLDTIQATYPDILSSKTNIINDWDVNTEKADVDSLAEKDIFSDISTHSDDTKDENSLAFLDDSELLTTSLADEISKDNKLVAKKSTDTEQNNKQEEKSKIDLAKGYIEMGDIAEATTLLNEIIASGSDEEQEQAKELLEKLS